MLNTGRGISDEFEMETLRYVDRDRKGKPYKIFRNIKDKVNYFTFILYTRSRCLCYGFFFLSTKFLKTHQPKVSYLIIFNKCLTTYETKITFFWLNTQCALNPYFRQIQPLNQLWNR